ncbi:protein starmaker-like [Papaver somniferum]|uniref:protein starmaker-like n=1 Tax=Papaver somniferum TaxID=3469 RepID=UPI000E6FBC79|nr:protein starmaker-like [Papaver somniferum]
MKQIEAEAEAEVEEDSDSDDDPEARPDFIPDTDSDEDEDSDDKYDDSDDEKDKNDLLQDNQKNSLSHNSRPKRTVRAPSRYMPDYAEAGSSADVRVVVDDRKRRSGKFVTVVEVEDSNTRVGEDSEESVDIEHRVHAREYPTDGLSFEAPMINNFPDNEVVGGFAIPKCHTPLYTKIWKRYGHIATTEVWKGFLPTLLTTVVGLLPIIEDMDQMRLRDVRIRNCTGGMR